jgi:hypothetical protein
MFDVSRADSVVSCDEEYFRSHSCVNDLDKKYHFYLTSGQHLSFFLRSLLLKLNVTFYVLDASMDNKCTFNMEYIGA